MSDNTDLRLDQAIEEFRSSALDSGRLRAAEAAILDRLRPTSRTVLRKLVWVGASAAVGLGIAAMLWPTQSAAAALQAIGKNGDVGLRHVIEAELQPDGTWKRTMEFYACGDRARIVSADGSQLIWSESRPIDYHPDGSAFIWPGSRSIDARKVFDWSGFTMSEVAKQRPDRVIVQHGVKLNGRTVDRYETNQDASEGGPVHIRTVFFADTATQRPIREEQSITGHQQRITTWDYPAYDERLLEGPPVDPKRFYDGDAEQTSMLAALKTDGPVQIVAGQRVQLVQLWGDEDGNVAAITYAGYSYPGNYSLRINGKKVAALSEAPDETAFYHVEHPFTYKGRKMQIFNAFCSPGERKPDIPDVVTLGIPVVDGKKRLGFAVFKKVPIHRTWSIHEVLCPTTVPFFADSIQKKSPPTAPGVAYPSSSG